MEEMWEFLLNNSPKLVCKPRSKTPKPKKENKHEAKPSLKVAQKTIQRVPLKLNLINSSSISKLVTPTVTASKNKSPISRIQSKPSITPKTARKTIVPILTSIKSFKLLTTSRK